MFIYNELEGKLRGEFLKLMKNGGGGGWVRCFFP